MKRAALIAAFVVVGLSPIFGIAWAMGGTAALIGVSAAFGLVAWYMLLVVISEALTRSK